MRGWISRAPHTTKKRGWLAKRERVIRDKLNITPWPEPNVLHVVSSIVRTPVLKPQSPANAPSQYSASNTSDGNKNGHWVITCLPGLGLIGISAQYNGGIFECFLNDRNTSLAVFRLAPLLPAFAIFAMPAAPAACAFWHNSWVTLPLMLFLTNAEIDLRMFWQSEVPRHAKTCYCTEILKNILATYRRNCSQLWPDRSPSSPLARLRSNSRCCRCPTLFIDRESPLVMNEMSPGTPACDRDVTGNPRL